MVKVEKLLEPTSVGKMKLKNRNGTMKIAVRITTIKKGTGSSLRVTSTIIGIRSKTTISVADNLNPISAVEFQTLVAGSQL